MLNVTIRMSKNLFLFLLIVVVSVVSINFLDDLRWREEIVRTGSVPLPPLQPTYGYYNLRQESAAYANNEAALGFDFAQVYYAAKAMSQGYSPYDRDKLNYRDPLNRLCAYPPVTVQLFGLISGFNYRDALMIHNFGVLLVFILFTGFLMFRENLQGFIWQVFVVYTLLYFYTPIGFTHFERGQFELFTAMSFMVMFFSIFFRQRKEPGLIAAGFFASLKFTSLPFIGALSFISLAADGSRKRWVYLLPLGTVLFTLLIYWDYSRQYFSVVRNYETFSKQAGVTLAYFFSPLFTKLFQVICMLGVTGVVLLFSEKGSRRELLEKISFPFALAMASQGCCFGIYNYEYRVVSMLGLIPGFVLWDARTSLPSSIKKLVSVSFAVFLVISFRTFANNVDVDPVIMTGIYLLCSLVWLSTCIYIIFDKRSSPAGFEATSASVAKTVS